MGVLHRFHIGASKTVCLIVKYLAQLFISFPFVGIFKEIKTYWQYGLNSDKRDSPRNADYSNSIYKYFEDKSSERINNDSRFGNNGFHIETLN